MPEVVAIQLVKNVIDKSLTKRIYRKSNCFQGYEREDNCFFLRKDKIDMVIWLFY